MFDLGCPTETYGCPRVVLAFHGGNFTGGSHMDDVQQNELLSHRDVIVLQPDFPRTIAAFREWMLSEPVQSLFHKYQIILLGRSSGAYLAKLVYEKYKAEASKAVCRAVYLAPVFDPERRLQLVPNMKRGTREFFGDEAIPALTEFDEWETIYIADNDENVPDACQPSSVLEEAIVVEGDHKSVCMLNYDDDLDQICSW